MRALIPSSENQNLFPDADLEIAFDAAIVWHSRYVKRGTVMLGTGDGSTQIWSLPSDFVDIKRVEYPYGTAPPDYMDSNDYEVHYGTSGYNIVFDTAPNNGTVFAAHYNGTWGTATLDSGDKQSIAYLSCALMCLKETARMNEHVTEIWQADSLNFRGMSRMWLQLKDHFISLYAMNEGLSAEAIKDGAPPAAWGQGAVPVTRRYERFWWDTE